MMQFSLRRAALVFGAAFGVVSVPAAVQAQKALVYCPVAVDATGCNTIVTALTGAVFPLGVDRGYDGTSGTVDLKTVDLFSYSVFVVPSLADGSTSQPYAKLRDPEVVEHLKAALIGRIAMWSGSPDQGATNRAMKDALIQNLAGWAGGAFGAAKGPGLVALLDASSSSVARYDWVRAITPVPVTSDGALLIYTSVRSLNARATTILTSGAGPIAYDNMATFGFQVPNGAAGVSLDAVGQTGTTQGGQVVLLTVDAGNSSGATVKTDKDDYAPGQIVTITGSGWQAGEAVKLTLHMDPLRANDTELTATADGNGNFTNTDFRPQEYDVGVRFVLTASGQGSGRRAQTTFTDGSTTITGTVRSSAPGNPVIAGAKIKCSSVGPNPCNNADSITTSANGQYSLKVEFAGNSATVRLEASAAGFTSVTADVAASNTNSPVQNFTLTPSALSTNTVAVNATATYGDANVTLSATVSASSAVNSGTVTFSVKQNGTLIGNAVTSSTVSNGNASVVYPLPGSAVPGGYTIEAAYNPGAGFSASSDVTHTLTIDRATVTVSFTASDKDYDGTNTAIVSNCLVTSGKLGSDDVTCSVSAGTFASPNASATGQTVTATATLVGTAAARYTVAPSVTSSAKINPRPLTVTFTAADKLYDGTTAATVSNCVVASGKVGSDDVTCAVANGMFASPNAGPNAQTVSATATLGGTKAGNYAVTNSVTTTAKINPKVVTITPTSGQSKVFGGSEPQLTFSNDGGLAGGGFTGALARAPGEDVGVYDISLGNLSAGTDYTLALAATAVKFEITPKPVTITPTADQSKVYGTNDPTLTFANNAALPAGAFTGAVSRAAGEDVGNYGITLGNLSAGTNYVLNMITPPVTFAIMPATVTVTFAAADKVYDGSAAADVSSCAIATGKVGSDDVTCTVAGGTFASANAGPSTQVVSATVTLGGAKSGNYIVSNPVTSSAKINPKTITVSFTANDKQYDGLTDAAVSACIIATGKVGTDDLSCSVAGGNFASPNAAVSPQTVAATAMLGGAAATNYAVSNPVTSMAKITPAPLKITASSATKTYGQAYTVTPAFDGFVNGEANSALTTQPSCSSAGSPATAPVSGSVYQTSCAGAAAGNYAISYAVGALTVNRASLTVKADDKAKDWDKQPYSPFTATITGFVNGETGSVVSGSATFTGNAVGATNPGIYTITPVIGTLSAANYQFTPFTNGTLKIIDTTSPVVTNTTVSPNPVPLGTGTTVTVGLKATVSDVATGGSDITKVCYRVDTGTGPGTCTTMIGAPGGSSVDVTATISLPAATDVVEVCIYGTDSYGNTNLKMDCALVAVYDPNFGFVTGGGWIMSPVGAYVPNGSLTGKANFGFVSKYKKGQTAPDGSTEFQFHAGELNFKSSAYEWLVVAGARAQFKGTGTLNGSGNYGFLLSAIDGQVSGGGGIDKFRIKIWNIATGATIYDNQTGASDASDPTTVLGGGSINIQPK